jgi:hypothetical protein
MFQWIGHVLLSAREQGWSVLDRAPAARVGVLPARAAVVRTDMLSIVLVRQAPSLGRI